MMLRLTRRLPAFLALACLACTSSRTGIPPSPPSCGFTQIARCSEIPGISDTLKGIAVGDSIEKVHAVPTWLSICCKAPPKEWGDTYEVCWDDASKKDIYFFHDGKHVTSIAFANACHLVFNWDLQNSTIPVQYEFSRELSAPYGILILEEK